MSKEILIIIVVSIATIITRWLPFLVFNDVDNLPPVINYLSKVLPYSIMAMLVVYCLKDINILSNNHGFPEIIAVGVTIVVHLVKENTLLSILLGTIVYMVCVQMIFI